MMSDEEKFDDKYIRHQPTYRSEKLNSFIQMLDRRLENMPSRHARHVRVLGSPVERRPPARAKKWMIKNTETPPDEDNNQGRVSDTQARLSDEGSFDLSD